MPGAAVRLVHHDPVRGAERTLWLREHGYQPVWENPIGPDLLRALTESPPAAILIDLSRRPAQGRDLAVALRVRKGTRAIPIVFLEGAREKVRQIRRLLPDAVYTAWQDLPEELEAAIAKPPAEPVVPSSVFAGYSGTPLVKKLGIKPGMNVGLVHAPADFRATLGELPEKARLHGGPQPGCALTIWFADSRSEVEAEIERIAALVADGGLWIGWKKKASGQATDLTQQFVRDSGLAIGLVDYKICSIDATWSALLFTWRHKKS